MEKKKHLRGCLASTAGVAFVLIAGLLISRSQSFHGRSVASSADTVRSPETRGEKPDEPRPSHPSQPTTRDSASQPADTVEASLASGKLGSADADKSVPTYHELPLYTDSKNWVKTALPCWAFHGNVPAEFVVAADERTRTSGRSSATIEAGLTSGWGTLQQFASAQDVRGKRVEFSVDIRTVAVALRASIFVRVDDAKGNAVALDNMWFNYVGDTKDPHRLNRSLSGDNEWTTERVVLDIPLEAATVSYGVTLEGAGKVWVDNAQLEAVGSETPVTAIVRPARLLQGTAFSPTKTLSSPTNLDFERHGSFNGACD